jgi:hypothetical protein
MRRRLWIILAIVVVAVGAVLLWPRGIKAVVRNAGGETMKDVHVLVTGRSYALGDIQPNEVRSVRVNPVGESSIKIQYTDAAGASRSADAACYIESGYSGSITVDIANGTITRKVDGVRITPL